MNERQTEREARKFVLNDQWLKPFLTLHRHSGESKSEHAAAGALFIIDLSLAPVVNTAQPDDEGSHEFEEGSDEFPDPEPIETHQPQHTD